MKNRTLLCPASFLVYLTSLSTTPYIATAEDRGYSTTPDIATYMVDSPTPGTASKPEISISHTSADCCLSFLCQPPLDVQN